MALYVRLCLSFWTNRKTIRLRALLGDSALWIPPRIWCYAAENQPDGDFSGYTADEIALLIGYSGNPHEMLEALQQSGFMDGMKIHSWDEHNEYHSVFSARAKAAAAARWADRKKKAPPAPPKERSDKKGKDIEPSIASSMLDDATCNASSNASSIKAKPLSENEVVEFAMSVGLTSEDGHYFWNKWEGNGYRNAGKVMKDWKATIRSWKNGGYCPSQKNQHGNGQHQPELPKRRSSRDLPYDEPVVDTGNLVGPDRARMAGGTST